MAPANGAANLRKGSAARPRPKSTVIPAIPLPYIQRRAQNHAHGPAAQPAASQTNGDAQETPKGVFVQPVEAESQKTASSNGTRIGGEVQAPTAETYQAEGIVEPHYRELFFSPLPS